MKFEIGLAKPNAEERLRNRGISRRDFLKFCGTVAAVMGLEASVRQGNRRCLDGQETAFCGIPPQRRMHRLLRSDAANRRSLHR